MADTDDTVIEIEETVVTEGETKVKPEETPVENEEVTVSIGEGSPPSEDDSKAPEWVRELRKNHREAAKRIRELETELAQARPKVEPKAKPTLESSGYDETVYEQNLVSWHEEQRQVAQAEAEAQRAKQADAEAWKASQEAFKAQKGELKVSDFNEAQAAVEDDFSITQQGIILHGAKNSAIVTYALGKNPAVAKELSSIKDPIKFAFAVANLEAQLKVTAKSKLPPPEKRISAGGNSLVNTADKALDKLRSEAAITGDYTAVVRYKAQLKAAQSK